jgi:hypothetical protein
MVAKLQNRDVICTVYRRVVDKELFQHPHMRFEGPNWSGKAFVVAFANVDCSVYATGSTRTTVVDSLRKVFQQFGATDRTAGHF